MIHVDPKVLSFVVGAAVGGACGFFAGYIFFKRKKEAELDQRIEECNAAIAKNKEDHSSMSLTVAEYMKLYAGELEAEGKDPANDKEFNDIFKKVYEKTGEVPPDPAEAEHPEDDEPEPEQYYDEDGRMITKEEFEEKRRIESMPEDERRREIDEDYRATAEMNEQKRERKPPRIITSESYNDEYRHFSKEELYYYSVDDILTTADDKVVDDEYELVGGALDKYGFRNNDEMLIYVRNTNLGTDYMITKVHSAYSDIFPIR